MELQIEHLCKRYPKGARAMQDVSLDIPAGMSEPLRPNETVKSALMRTLAILLFLLLSCFSVGQQTSASTGLGDGAREETGAKSPGDYSKEATVVQRRRTSYFFENDGRGKRADELSMRVQSEAGVKEFGQLRFGYNSANQNIEIEYVRVRKPDGSAVTADATAIQDLTGPVARIAPIYTDYREKHVTVPALRPGDTLEYKIVINTTQPLAPNQFWMEHDFRDDRIVLDEQLTVDVPQGRVLKLKTQPEFADYQKRDEGDRRIYTWKWKNLTTRAAREKAEEESNPKKKHKKAAEQPASVQLTTFSSWEEVGKWYAGLERERRQPSEDVSAKARELTKDLSTDQDKVRAVYDYVAKNYRYVSLSFGLGRYQPHAADEVFKNQYGDCKDKETLLAAMLDSLGYRMNTVLIHSHHKLDEDVPSPLQFDHVIGNLSLSSGMIWMDTTTEVAPIGMLLFPLRDKKALQIAPDGSAKIAVTPAKVPYDTVSRDEVEGQITPLGKLEAHSKLTLRGDGEVVLRSVLRRFPEAQWSDIFNGAIAHWGMRGGKVSNIKISDLADTATPLVAEFDVDVPNFLDWTASETKFHLPLGAFSVPSLDEEDTEPAKLGGPSTHVGILKLRLPETLTATAPAPVTVKRDYAEYSASYTAGDHLLTAERKLVIKAMEVEPSRASDLNLFARILTTDSQQQVRIENTSGNAERPSRETKTEELEQAARHAFQSRKFKESAELYELVTEKDPKNKFAWNNLGRAYLALKLDDKAVAAFKKALAVNAYDPWAWNNLGRAYEQQQRYGDAILAYQKQVEINPLDQWAHANLGILFLRLRRNTEAVSELERAVEISPDNAGVKIDLGKAYLRTDRSDKAMGLFEKALQKSSGPSTWNGVAYSLAENNQHLDKALEYAKSAVSTTETRLRNLPPEKVEQAGLQLSANLAAYWDTLGWVYFQQGDTERAERYIAAAWKHSEFGEVGYHLGKIYEKKGDKQKAIEMYAAAAAANAEVTPEALNRLKELVNAQTAEQMVAEQRTARVKQRTMKLDWTASDETADVLLTFTGTGEVDSAKFLAASKGLKAHEADLSRLKLNIPLPDSTTQGFVHKGTLSCANGSICKLLWLPSDGSAASATPPRSGDVE